MCVCVYNAPATTDATRMFSRLNLTYIKLVERAREGKGDPDNELLSTGLSQAVGRMKMMTYYKTVSNHSNLLRQSWKGEKGVCNARGSDKLLAVGKNSCSDGFRSSVAGCS